MDSDANVVIENYTHVSVVMGLTADWLSVEAGNYARDNILRVPDAMPKKH